MDTRVRLGRTGLTVSTLCFGTGYMTGSVTAGARLLVKAHELGISFWDTSDDYGTHPHVARALREVGRDKVVVATKTYASTAVGARRAVTRALRELGVDAVDVFLLHAVDSAGELEAKSPALEALSKAKAEGLIRAVGVSSHSRQRYAIGTSDRRRDKGRGSRA
jgi:aryl-alcohol dehydrogenase-like predicted oxidoreductase